MLKPTFPLLAALAAAALVLVSGLSGSATAAPQACATQVYQNGLDVVFGYQTTWLLLCGDSSRYSPSAGQAAVAVFLGLALTALWFIPLGLVASTIAHSSDPGVMVQALKLGWWGGILVVLATLTTNFVNIYMSALAMKSLWPSVPDRSAIWVNGGVGAAISVLSATWLDQLANFTLVLAGLFVPVGGILIAHFIVRGGPQPVEALYPGPGGKPPAVWPWSTAGMTAWIAGAIAFYVAQPIGGVAPSLAVAIVSYLVVARPRQS